MYVHQRIMFMIFTKAVNYFSHVVSLNLVESEVQLLTYLQGAIVCVFSTDIEIRSSELILFYCLQILDTLCYRRNPLPTNHFTLKTANEVDNDYTIKLTSRVVL